MNNTVSELYMEASRKYRISSYTYTTSGAIAGAFLIFSLLSLDHNVTNTVLRVVFAVLIFVDFYMTVRCTSKADENRALAEKWRNL